MQSSLRALPFLALLVCGALLLLDAAGAQAQRFPRELENIKMFGKGESIQFVFSQPYEGNPVVDSRKGAFSLSFSGTGSTKPVRALRPVAESIYKEIKVVQNRYSTTVTFDLKDEGLDLKDKLAFTADKNVLKLAVNAPAPKSVTSPQGQASQDLLREMEDRITGRSEGGAPGTGTTGADAGAAGGLAAAEQPATDGSALAFGDLAGGEFFWSLVTMVIALVIIVAGLYGMLYLYNRFLATRLRRFTGSHAIRQVASFHIGPRQRIVVIEINDEIIACGVTPSQITYLTHLGGKGPIGRPNVAGGEETDAVSALAGGLKPSAEPEARPAPGDPVHQFAEVLKQKVRSLKRIN